MGYSDSEEFKTDVFSEDAEETDTTEQIDNDIDEEPKNNDFTRQVKSYIRLLRRTFSAKLREKMQKNFTNIIYLTLDCPECTPNSERCDSPFEYIKEIRKQYPENNIKIMLPLIGVDEETFKPSRKISLNVGNNTLLFEKTSVEFDYYLQNRTNHAILYKIQQNDQHIDVYAVFSPNFSYCQNISEISKIQHLAPFMKAARIGIKKLGKDGFPVDIVHSENIPFFLGSEFENNAFYGIKVLQIIKDFTQIELNKIEPFWAAINLADKFAMTRICTDLTIKKCIFDLFDVHSKKRSYQIHDCIKYIYKNYQKFRRYIDKGADIDENVLFNKLNERTPEIFPQMFCTNQAYNIMLYSMRRADYWATISKTYYKEIFENPKVSGDLYDEIVQNKEKGKYLSLGFDKESYITKNNIYKEFNIENFRTERNSNKKALLKEFNIDRIKTKFIDSSLFKDDNYEIKGCLDSFYEAPLFFAYTSAETFANGVDILFNTLLKMFELHKNIQVIICIKDGLKNNFIKSWVDFLLQNRYLNGRWIFIDGEINSAKFLAGSDMILMPRRINMATPEHYMAMAYGCVPIVSKCGILNDTILDIFDDITNGCGLKTKTTLLAEGDVNETYIDTVLKALHLYQNNPYSWNLLIKNCMQYDSSWSFKILEKYNKLYNDLM